MTNNIKILNLKKNSKKYKKISSLIFKNFIKIEYFIFFKTFGVINFKILNINASNLASLKKIKIKNFIVSKSPFKYNKSKEQFGLKKEFLEIKIIKNNFNPKILEVFLQKIFFFSNKVIINIKKKEYFNNLKFLIYFINN